MDAQEMIKELDIEIEKLKAQLKRLEQTLFNLKDFSERDC